MPQDEFRIEGNDQYHGGDRPGKRPIKGDECVDSEPGMPRDRWLPGEWAGETEECYHEIDGERQALDIQAVEVMGDECSGQGTGGRVIPEPVVFLAAIMKENGIARGGHGKNNGK